MDIQVIRSSYVPKKDIFSVIFPTGHSPELVRPVLHPLPSPHTHTRLSRSSFHLAPSSSSRLTRSLLYYYFYCDSCFHCTPPPPQRGPGEGTRSRRRRRRSGVNRVRFSLFSTRFSFGSSQKKNNQQQQHNYDNNNNKTKTQHTRTTQCRRRKQ